MKEFARLTSVIFIILGLLIILAGVAFVFFPFDQTPTSPAAGLLPDVSGMVAFMRLLGGCAIGLQGLFLMAIGQGLWLLAGIQEQTQKTAEALAGLRRSNQQRY